MTSATPLPLHVTSVGEGPPVVVLHGLLGRARNWLSMAKALEQDYAFQLVDLRNHGASPWSDEMSYPAMAGDVATLIERLDAGPLRVVGHSMGGKVAMHLALSRPELVERLVVVDIAPIRYAHGFEQLIEAMLAVPLERTTRRADVDAAMRAAVPDPGLRAFLMQNLGAVAGGLAWQPNLNVLLRAMPEIASFPAEHAGSTFPGRVHCLRGATSTYVEAEGEAALRRYFPTARLDTVAGAGHWPHAEQPAAFLALLAPALAA